MRFFDGPIVSFGHGSARVRLWRRISAGFAKGPTKADAAHPSGDEERQMRALRPQFLRAEEFEKSRKQVLRRVLAAERGKRENNLGRRAMKGRNKNEQQERL